jgi:predicted ATPase
MTGVTQHLTRLEVSGLIQLAQTQPELEYLFRHALVRDAAYQSLLKADRKPLHRAVAEAMERLYPDQLDELAPLLGHHYSQANQAEKAIHYLHKAGEQAVLRYANPEAIGFFGEALALLKTLPVTPEQTQQELDLQIALGNLLMASQGYGSPEVARVYGRARELCGQVEATPQLLPVLYGLWAYYTIRAEFSTARQLAEETLRLSQHQPGPDVFFAHRMLGSLSYYIGEFASARSHIEQRLALYDPRQRQTFVTLYGVDPKVLGLSYLALILWLLGYPSQALARCREALDYAQQVSHPFSLGYALAYASVFHYFRREWQATQAHAEEGVTLSNKQGFALFSAGGTIWRGWILAKQGHVEEGIAQILQGLAVWQAIGAKLLRPFLLGLLAEAHGMAGQAGEGLATLTEALAQVDKTGERMWEAELYRLKGELLLQQGEAEAEVEACFNRAIDVARRQNAKSLELRATVSMSRLWQAQGKKAEARRVLAEIYGWFTEGFDTRDLQEAKSLLDELS